MGVRVTFGKRWENGMSKKRTASARRSQLRRRRVEHQSAPVNELSDSAFGIAVTRIRPGGGRERLQIKWNVDDESWVALMGLHRLRKGVLAPLERELVEQLREEGFSWADIGRLLEVTGEAVRLRFSS